MKKPIFIPIVEIRKLWWNCSANCPWCSKAQNEDYSEWLELSIQQEIFIKKINKIFNFEIDKKENTILWFSIPFPFDKIIFEEFKKEVLNLNIDTAWSFWFMLSDNIDDLNNNLNDILDKIKYIFELNIENTWRKKNSTLELCSNKWGLQNLDNKKDDLIIPIKEITELCKWYVKNEIALQIWRLVVTEDNYETSKIESQKIIKYINEQLKEYKTEIEIVEGETYSQYEIIIETNEKEKIIVHLALVKQIKDYKEDINEHIELVQTMQHPLLLSTLDNHIQINHSLWKVNDKENLLKYKEIMEVLDEVSILKEKLIKIDFLKDTDPIFFLLQKINLLKKISIKRNIYKLFKDNNFTDLEKQSISNTDTIIDNSEFDLVEHTKKWLLPSYILWTYMRNILISILDENKKLVL